MRIRLIMASCSAMVVMTGCSGTASLSESAGQVRYVDGFARITVPALWAGADADGNPVGGIEPAEIVVSTAGVTPEYEVDLADIQAQGAGNAWRAATSMASAFATIFASVDPATVDLNFTVTGPIDGPSAGGILTVGLIAAFEGTSLQPGYTMTGTITADGSIGPVGGVLTKIESAAREGFTSVVLPASLAPGTWDKGNDFIALAESLGVTVIPVHTIGEAYAAMTGAPSETFDVSENLPLGERAQLVTQEVSSEVVALLDQQLQSIQLTDVDLKIWADQVLIESKGDLITQDYARAYGNTALALTRLVRAQAADDAEKLIRTEGIDPTRELILSRAQEVQAQSQTALARGARTPMQGISQCFALPTALGWASFAQVTAEGIVDQISSVSDPLVIIDFAQSLAESELGVETFMPQALGVIRALDVAAGEDCSGVAQHLSGYSRFLVQAAEAGKGYLGEVLGSGLEEADISLKQDYAAGALAAEEIAQSVTSKVDPYPAEVEQFTTALTYFWLTSYAVSAKQAYEVMPSGTEGYFAAMRLEAMNIAVDQTWWFVKYRAEILAQQGIDPSSAVWSARWALEESLANRNGLYSTDADWLALGELWFDAVQMTTTLSYVSPTTITEPIISD